MRAIGLQPQPDDWLDAFTVIHREADDERDGNFDVDLVDVTAEECLALVARLAQGTRPVIVIGPDDPRDVERYLQAGAADYLTSRFAGIERAARVQSAARRVDAAERAWGSDVVRIGDVTISPLRHEVLRGGVPVRLTRNEFRLLELLLERADTNVPHRDIVHVLWDEESASSRHYVRAYIRQLRDKLEADPEHPSLIVTEWGVGYRLQRSDDADRSAAG